MPCTSLNLNRKLVTPFYLRKLPQKDQRCSRTLREDLETEVCLVAELEDLELSIISIEPAPLPLTVREMRVTASAGDSVSSTAGGSGSNSSIFDFGMGCGFIFGVSTSWRQMGQTRS